MWEAILGSHLAQTPSSAKNALKYITHFCVNASIERDLSTKNTVYFLFGERWLFETSSLTSSKLCLL